MIRALLETYDAHDFDLDPHFPTFSILRHISLMKSSRQCLEWAKKISASCQGGSKTCTRRKSTSSRYIEFMRNALDLALFLKLLMVDTLYALRSVDVSMHFFGTLDCVLSIDHLSLLIDLPPSEEKDLFVNTCCCLSLFVWSY